MENHVFYPKQHLQPAIDPLKTTTINFSTYHSGSSKILPSAPTALDTLCALIGNIRGGLGGGKSGTCSLCSSELEWFSSDLSTVV